MLPIATVQAIAQERLADADVLLAHGRPDGAQYMCGYAVEMALKARVCQAEGLAGLPENNSEFTGKYHLKTHNLAALLTKSGKEAAIKATHFVDWSVVAYWNPESRYQAIGAVSAADAATFIASAKILIPVIYS